MLAVHALLISQRLSLTQLGRRLASKALVKHNTKRIDRLLGNPHLYQKRNSLYRFLCQELLKDNQHALTLYEEVHPQKDNGSPKVHKRFLHILQNLLPDSCCPIVIADAGPGLKWSLRRAGIMWAAFVTEIS